MGGDDLTVKQVIRYYAHAEGGVHFGVPEDPVEAKLARLAPLLAGHSTGQIEILARLGRVTAQALEPLRDAILARPTVIAGLHLPAKDGLLMHHWTAEHIRASLLAVPAVSRWKRPSRNVTTRGTAQAGRLPDLQCCRTSMAGCEARTGGG